MAKKSSKSKLASENDAKLLPAWKKNFVIGIDDCICVTRSKKVTRAEILAAEEVRGAKEWVNEKFEKGHHICFLTTRPERLRKPTEMWLETHGFKYHDLVMEKPDAVQYHYIDDRHVRATTFKGRFTKLIKKQQKIEIFH